MTAVYLESFLVFFSFTLWNMWIDGSWVWFIHKYRIFGLFCVPYSSCRLSFQCLNASSLGFALKYCQVGLFLVHSVKHQFKIRDIRLRSMKRHFPCSPSGWYLIVLDIISGSQEPLNLNLHFIAHVSSVVH